MKKFIIIIIGIILFIFLYLYYFNRVDKPLIHDLTPNIIYTKLYNAMKGNSGTCIVLCYFNLIDYDEQNKLVTLKPFVCCKDSYDATQLKDIPIFFLNKNDEKHIAQAYENQHLNKIKIHGYFDTEFMCFVCLHTYYIKDTITYE